MQPDRRQAAAQWRDAGAEDLRVARLLEFESPSVLKAVAVAVGDDLPRTRVLNDLADELLREGIAIPEAIRAHLRVLERLYAPTRYPDALGGIDPNRVFGAADATDAIARAQAVFAFADGIVGSAR